MQTVAASCTWNSCMEIVRGGKYVHFSSKVKFWLSRRVKSTLWCFSFLVTMSDVILQAWHIVGVVSVWVEQVTVRCIYYYRVGVMCSTSWMLCPVCLFCLSFPSMSACVKWTVFSYVLHVTWFCSNCLKCWCRTRNSLFIVRMLHMRGIVWCQSAPRAENQSFG